MSELIRNPELNNHNTALPRIGSNNSSIKFNNVTLIDAGEIQTFNLELTVSQGEHLAIIGENGVSKSSILRAIAGYIQASEGSIIYDRNARISLLPQNIDSIDNMSDESTVKDVFFEARGIYLIQEMLNETYSDYAKEPAKYEEKLSFLQTMYESLGGYGEADAELAKIINGLKVNVSTHDNIGADSKILDSSSGQRTKLLLGRALFARPDILLLENPSSYLDIEAQNWLASYIKNSDFTIIVSTQDNNFASKFADKFLEISKEGVSITKDTDSLSDFMAYRDSVLGSLIKKRELAQTNLTRLIESQRRLAVWGVISEKIARKAYVMEGRVERAAKELDGMLQIETGIDMQVIPFECKEVTGDTALTFGNVRAGYKEKNIVSLNSEIPIDTGKNIRITGRNGSGKSTFMKALILEYSSLDKEDAYFKDLEYSGYFKLSPRAKVGVYYPSMFIDEKYNDKLVREYLGKYHNVGKYLKYWGFDPSYWNNRKIKEISNPDQRARFMFLNLMLEKPNVLMLDEPTGAMSDAYLTRLANSLLKYRGTLIYISHDQQFNNMITSDYTLELPNCIYTSKQ